MKEQTKCVSVNLSTCQIEEIKNIRKLTGKSQNAVLLESIDKGIGSIPKPNTKLFMVKVRINLGKMEELGAKLQSGELDLSPIKFTYCIENEPTVGISLWEVKDSVEFEEKFAPHSIYYKDIIEINEVVLPEKAMELIMSSMV